MREQMQQLNGIYPNRDAADAVVDELLRAGIGDDQICMVSPADPDYRLKLDTDVRSVARRIARQTVIGAVLGALLALAVLMTVAGGELSNLSELSPASIVVPIGFGMLLGVTLVSLWTMGSSAPHDVRRINQALERGHWAVAVVTGDAKQATKAGNILSSSMLLTQGEELSRIAVHLRRTPTRSPLTRQWSVPQSSGARH